MKLEVYKEAVKRTMPQLKGSLLNQKDNIHMILGLTTEVGELADIFKRELAYKKEIDKVNVEEEIGDILWYLINFCHVNNIDIEKCMGKNISKLYARFPEKFSEDKALIRDLENERKILENESE